ncbi:MAG: hypothetical protein XU10_C0004G0122 [Chloroflexi bacterium CSP1-4]|nr:MAG: hypothetical protein XU10_C0004G0122 [Chloroflexi bacterium CSP1-4]
MVRRSRFVKRAMRRPDPDPKGVGEPVERQVEVAVQDDHRAMIDGEPAAAALELVAVEDRARVPVRYVKLATAAAAMVVVALVATNLLPTGADVPERGAAVTPSPARSPSPSPSPLPSRSLAPRTNTGTEYSAIAPGRYDVPWTQGRIRLTMPAGWLSANAGFGWCEARSCLLPQGGTTITKDLLEVLGPTLSLSLAHDVEFITLRVRGCADLLDLRTPNAAPVGPTVDHLSTALANQTGGRRSGPIDVTLGGYPAWKFVLTMPALVGGTCRYPQGHDIWMNATTYGFTIPEEGTGTVYIVDVNRERLVITSLDRGASAEDLAQLEAIIASIEIEPSAMPVPVPATAFLPMREPLAIGRYAMTVGGVPVSFEVPTNPTDDGWSSNGAFYISKSTTGPQGAEAAILWTSFPDGGYPVRCLDELGPEVGTTAADLAAAVASAPADPIALEGPSDVIVGGRPAKHVVFTVGDDHGCQPGFFYTWPAIYGGPLWGETRRGDTISVWIVDVDGVLLVIEGITTTWARPKLGQELQQIVESIRFE